MKKEKIKGTARARVKRGDEVVFVAGKEFNRYDSEGKRNPYRGKVIAVDPRTGRVKVDGAMIVKRHKKAVPQMNVKGGIIQMEAWVDISNVAVVDPETGNPSRVRYEMRDGEKVRITKSGAVIPEPAIYVRAEKEVEEEGPAAEEAVTEETEETPADESKTDESKTDKSKTDKSEEE